MKAEQVATRNRQSGPESLELQDTHSTRGFFGKYSDTDKAIILWKSSLALTIVGFALALTGLILNRYAFNEQVSGTVNGVAIEIPYIVVSSFGVEVGSNGCLNGLKVDPSNSILHSKSGMPFSILKDGGGQDEAAVFFLDDSRRVVPNTHLGDFKGFYVSGTASRVFSIVGVALQGMALLWTVILKAVPSPFFLNRAMFGQSHREHLIGAAYHLILMASALSLFVSNTLMSTIMAPLLARVANFALDRCEDSPFDAVPRNVHDIEYMKFLGTYIQGNSNASGVTYVTFAVSMALIYAQVALVSYLGIRQAKAQSRVHNHIPRSQELLLPWYCKIPEFRWSVGLLIIATLAIATTAFSARLRGFDLNMFFYRNFFEQKDLMGESWSLGDMILDRIKIYVVDKSVVTFMLALWIPVTMIVGFGAVDYIKYTSKVIQTLAVLMILSAIIGISTIPPTPAFILQKPQCFSKPRKPPTFGQFFEISESCNDQIYSLYSVLLGVPLMMIYFYVRYGSVRRKKLAYIALALLGIASQFLVVATRLQYTVDVYIGFAVTVMYCLSQSPAFKLLFRFGIVHQGVWNKRPVVLSDKLNPSLDNIIRRLELHLMAANKAHSTPRDDLDLVRGELNHAKEALEFAKEKALDEIPDYSDNTGSSQDILDEGGLDDSSDSDDTKKYN